MKEALSPKLSAMVPTASGNKAPPKMARHSSPDVELCETPDRSSVMVKIVGNMIELKKPIGKRGIARDRRHASQYGQAQERPATMPQAASRRVARTSRQKRRSDQPPAQRAAPVEIGEIGAGIVERQRRAPIAG